MPDTDAPPREPVVRWVLLALVLIVGSYAYYLRYHTGQNAMAFDRARWLAFELDENGYSNRYSMVGDLLRHHELVGMTRKEVEGLLGPPQTESQNDIYPYPGWDLGLLPGFMNTDSTALCLQFGPDGRVTKVWNPGR